MRVGGLLPPQKNVCVCVTQRLTRIKMKIRVPYSLSLPQEICCVEDSVNQDV